MLPILLLAITTNSVTMNEAPKWLTAARVNRVTDRIERQLEWSIHRVSVKWFEDEKAFTSAHGISGAPEALSGITAVSKKNENTIYLGPRVSASNFDEVFGHELAHIIMFQKYKDAIPKWLEEGLANYAAKKLSVDYRWLAAQAPVDVRTLSHPFGSGGPGPRYHYMASTALMEMIAAKCRVHDLLQLSVGEKLEAYLSTFCRITDLNDEFRKWVTRKAR